MRRRIGLLAMGLTLWGCYDSMVLPPNTLTDDEPRGQDTSDSATALSTDPFEEPTTPSSTVEPETASATEAPSDPTFDSESFDPPSTEPLIDPLEILEPLALCEDQDILPAPEPSAALDLGQPLNSSGDALLPFGPSEQLRLHWEEERQCWLIHSRQHYTYDSERRVKSAVREYTIRIFGVLEEERKYTYRDVIGLKKISGDRVSEVFNYDDNLQLIRLFGYAEDQNSDSYFYDASFTYDTVGALESRHLVVETDFGPDQDILETYQRTTSGRLSLITTGAESTVIDYDDKGRVIVVDFVPDFSDPTAEERTLELSYDDQGRLSSLVERWMPAAVEKRWAYSYGPNAVLAECSNCQPNPYLRVTWYTSNGSSVGHVFCLGGHVIDLEEHGKNPHVVGYPGLLWLYARGDVSGC